MIASCSHILQEPREISTFGSHSTEPRSIIYNVWISYINAVFPSVWSTFKLVTSLFCNSIKLDYIHLSISLSKLYGILSMKREIAQHQWVLYSDLLCYLLHCCTIAQYYRQYFYHQFQELLELHDVVIMLNTAIGESC